MTDNMCNLIYKSVRFFFFSLVIIQLAMANAAAWQDDPFDPFGSDEPNVAVDVDASGSPAAGDFDLDETLNEGVKLAIRAVRDSNPTTAMELARAIKSMLNIEQYGEANRYLNQLIGLNLDGSQIFDLSETVGATFLVDLQTVDQLQPAGGNFAKQAFKMARDEAYSPNRIAQLITELSDNNKFVRNDAFRKLRLLGAPAVAVMLEVCENDQRRKEIPFLRSALSQMGEPALMPLIGAVRADGTVAQAVAVGALSSVENQLAYDALLRASLSSFVPQGVQSIASESVSRQGLTGQYEIKQAIFERANEYLDGQIEIPADGRGVSTIWNWDFQKKKLVSTQISKADAMRILAVDLARDVFRLEPGNNSYRQLQLLTVAEATKRVLGPNRFVLLSEVKSYIPDLNALDLNQAIETAMQRQLTPAAVGAVELMGQTADTGLLVTGDGTNSPLVEAVISGNRELAYAACKTISQLDPKQAFPGCSYVGKMAALLANTDGRSTGVAVHPRTDLAQALASSISQAGAIGLTAGSGEQLFEMINTNPDIDFVLITDSLSRPRYQEVIQQLRSYWLSSTLPIALLTRNDKNERQAELIFDRDPMTIVLPLTSDPRMVFKQVNRLRGLRKNVVSNAQRNQHAAFAMSWISKLLDSPETYRFYHLAAHRDQLIDLVKIPTDYDIKSKILSQLGAPDAQITLAKLANDSALSATERQYCAQGFADSVSRFGIMLGSAQIRLQYDLYNNSESQSGEIQKILGSILDAIEDHVRLNTHSAMKPSSLKSQ